MNIQLQDRDLHILRAHARFKYLRKSQLISSLAHAGLAGSEQKLTRRLQSLVGAGHLVRPPAARVSLAGQPNPHGITALGRLGARELIERDGLDIGRFANLYKLPVATGAFIAHQLDTVDVVLSFLLGAEAAGVVAVLDDLDLLPYLPVATKATNPFLWPATAVPIPPTKGKPPTIPITLRPDRLLSLILPGDLRSNLVLELGRSLTIRPGRHGGALRRQSLEWKLRGYLHGWRQGLAQQRWNFARLRCLFVEPTQRRAEKVAELAREICDDKMPGFLLFAAHDAVTSRGAYAADVWFDQRGRHVSIVG